MHPAVNDVSMCSACLLLVCRLEAYTGTMLQMDTPATASTQLSKMKLFGIDVQDEFMDVSHALSRSLSVLFYSHASSAHVLSIFSVRGLFC